MATVMNMSSSLDIFAKSSFCEVSPFFTLFFTKQHHVEQKKANKLPVRSFMCKYSNRSWATTITALVAFTNLYNNVA